jgi:hypothetical protein
MFFKNATVTGWFIPNSSGEAPDFVARSSTLNGELKDRVAKILRFTATRTKDIWRCWERLEKVPSIVGVEKSLARDLDVR